MTDASDHAASHVDEEDAAPHPIVASEALFRGLTLHSADIISVLDEQGRLLYNSPATERINGFSAEDLANIDTFELIHPDDRDRVRAVFAKVLASPGSVHTVEYRYRTKEGGWLWIEAVASNQLDEPAVRGVVANCRDISERVRAEEERERLQAQMLHVQKLEGLGVLAGGVAHDFNNLLTVVRGGADWLLDASLTREQVHAVAGQIRDAAERAADLTYLLLAYAGRGSFSQERLSATELVAAMRPLLQLTVGRRNQLSVDASDELFVDGDPRQLRQVLLNLVQNAAESAAREVRVRVSVHRQEVEASFIGGCLLADELTPGPHVALVVEDDGDGVAERDRVRMFEPFFSTKAEGRGLGLAAVHGILRHHRAGLAVEEREGGGTRIGIYLPEVEAPRPTPVAAEATTPASQATILLIEDDEGVVHMTRQLLESSGFGVLVAHRGAEGLALRASHADRIDLVLLDLVMPGMNGAETYRQLRESAPTLPVLFYSGTDPESVREHLAEPSTGFLPKPFGHGELVDAVTRLLEASDRLTPRSSAAPPGVPRP